MAVAVTAMATAEGGGGRKEEATSYPILTVDKYLGNLKTTEENNDCLSKIG